MQLANSELIGERKSKSKIWTSVVDMRMYLCACVCALLYVCVGGGRGPDGLLSQTSIYPVITCNDT